MADSEDLSAALARRDHALGAREAEGDRDLDQRVLAGFKRLDRLRLVLLARTADDDDVDLGIGEGGFERHRPFAVAEALREFLGRLDAPSDHRVQRGPGGDQRLGMPHAHHPVADHADVHRASLPAGADVATPLRAG
jgi:hypothetical protein